MLADLPTELVNRIFEFVGPEHFRTDSRRLLVCRWWYGLSLPLFLGQLCLTAKSLGPPLRALSNDDTLANAKRFTKSFGLYLEPRDSQDPGTRSTLGSRDRGLQALQLAPVLELEELGSRLQELPCLNTLHLFPGQMEISLGLQSLQELLSLRYLTSLTIDLANVKWPPFHPSSYHLCDPIAALVPSLKILRCRLPCIVSSQGRNTPCFPRFWILCYARYPMVLTESAMTV